MSDSALERLRGLRIAHLSTSSGPGGAERVVAYVARRFQEIGAQTIVVLPDDGENWLACQLAGSGVRIEAIELRRSREAIRSLTRLFRREAFDVAHSHEFGMAVYGAWAAWRTNVRHVITMHGRGYYADRLRRRVALRLAVGLSGRTVTVSEHLKRRLCRDLWLPPSRVGMIWNGVPPLPVVRSSLRDELGLREGERLLLAVGNLYALKGHTHLVRALALLSERRPGVHLAIAGYGQMAERLAAQAHALGVHDRLHLLGVRSDIPNLLAGADVFVHPSLAEGLPLAVLEAMHAGCPIVATQVGEVGAALEFGEAGCLVDPADPAALAEAILRLLEDPAQARALAQRASERAAAAFDLSVMMRRYAELYCELLTQEKGSHLRKDLAAARIVARSCGLRTPRCHTPKR